MKAAPTATNFLRAIFGEKPADHHILIWELNRQQNTKRNNFFATIEQAADYASKDKSKGTDVYFCVGTLPKLKKGRGKLSDVLGIGAVHLDVDIVNPAAHKKQNLPATIDEAIAFVNQFDLKPSILVHSGYGLHAYWLLQDFLAFANEADHARAASLIESWQKMYKWAASKQGYDVDATQDLTRVLRVPDTFNWKVPEQPVAARIIHFDASLRYTPGDFDSFLSQNSQPLIPASTNGHQKVQKNATSSLPFNHIQIELNENAMVDTSVFESLMDNLPKFRLTWLRKRRDMQDTSASSYDMALANMALGAGLDDQTVCNLLIAHRRSHKDDLKLDRLDYYQRTLAEAHDKTDPVRAVNEALQKPADPTDKNVMRKHIRDVLGIDIERIEKFLIDPPYFVIHFAGGRQITVGDSKGLLEQKDFRRFVSNAIGKPPEKLTAKAWDKITPKIFALVEERQLAEDTSLLGQLKEWLFEYAREFVMPVADVQQHRQALARGAPGIIDGQVCIHAKEFWRYIVKHGFDTKITRAMVIAQLTRLDAKREKKSLRDDRSRVCSVSIYVLTADLSAEIISQMSYAGFADGDDEFADDVIYAGQPDKDRWLPQA